MRWAAKVDANQAEIVEALRGVGATVFVTHRVGQGFPDLVVGFRGVNYLMEVKDKGGKLTKAEKEFFNAWQGSVHMVETIDDALTYIGAIGS